MISFGADYTSRAGPVWDYMTIQLAQLAGNSVKMGNVGIKVSSAKRANSAHLITNAPEVIYSGKQSIPILANDAYKYIFYIMMWSTEIHRSKYTQNLRSEFGPYSNWRKKYQSWLWQIISWKRLLNMFI